MKKFRMLPQLKKLSLILAIVSICVGAAGQQKLDTTVRDTTAQYRNEINKIIEQTRHAQLVDSIKRAELVSQIELLKENEQFKRKQLNDQLNSLRIKDSIQKAENFERIQKLRAVTPGVPVAPFEDTLFVIYNKVGVLSPPERAALIASKIVKLYDDNTFSPDSLKIQPSEYGLEIGSLSLTVMTVSENDALWQGESKEVLAERYLGIIQKSIRDERDNNSLTKMLIRIGFVLLVLASLWFVVWLIRRAFGRLAERVLKAKSRFIKDVTYKNYKILSANKERRVLLTAIRISKWITIIFALYFSIPIMLSIFPFTHGWAEKMYEFVWSPFRYVLKAILDYLPNLVKIVAIVIVGRYVMKLARYVFKEIESGNLQFKGFHKDWAAPTFNIFKVVFYAFLLVVIFPFLPMSDSDIFKGVSVFVGVLFSLGSSSAISNMIAGLVITYMRPFKVGDHIKIGDMRGDVIEKSMLVTRLRTIKNEEITIPNASVLSSNTVNYSIYAAEQGLIVYTSVTIGYDVPRRSVEDALIEAAERSTLIQKTPKPYVFEQSLNDFHVEYQLNAYTVEANKQSRVYSELRQNILDVFNERGIEIMSPNYHAVRDGNKVTIPEEYMKNTEKN